MKAVATKLGVKHAETMCSWVRGAKVDAGAIPGTTTEESAELKPAASARGPPGGALHG